MVDKGAKYDGHCKAPIHLRHPKMPAGRHYIWHSRRLLLFLMMLEEDFFSYVYWSEEVSVLAWASSGDFRNVLCTAG